MSKRRITVQVTDEDRAIFEAESRAMVEQDKYDEAVNSWGKTIKEAADVPNVSDDGLLTLAMLTLPRRGTSDTSIADAIMRNARKRS